MVACSVPPTSASLRSRGLPEADRASGQQPDNLARKCRGSEGNVRECLQAEKRDRHPFLGSPGRQPALPRLLSRWHGRGCKEVNGRCSREGRRSGHVHGPSNMQWGEVFHLRCSLELANKRWRKLSGDGFEEQLRAREGLGLLKEGGGRTRKHGGMHWSSQIANAVAVRMHAVV